ncbi:hypothetical protein SAMN05216332_11624 [Nitrosospira briensis]|nr:hypothetical protein SAMN05216332_11624 [Nitrosospira briensis]
MAIDEVDGQNWTRKHDNPSFPVVSNAPRTLYPKSLEDLIHICTNRAPSERIHAAGSHWALSEAAISDSVFVETHDPNNLHQAMGRTLYDVVPACLNPHFVRMLRDVVMPEFDSKNVGENEGLYPIHVETGKRVYQLYAELDHGDDDPRSLATKLSNDGNKSYLGSWGFQTLGGSGGQTVFGALTTGRRARSVCTGRMGAEIPDRGSDVATSMGAGNPILCLSARGAQNCLHHQCHRKPAHATTQDRQESRPFPQ